MTVKHHEHRWCLVTGASTGIGRVVAEGLLADGMHVAGVARRAEALDELLMRWPETFVGVSHDVARSGLIMRLAELGVPMECLELVVHSAGCARQGVPLTQMADRDIEETISTNVLGTTLIVHDFNRLGCCAGCSTLEAAYAASKAYAQQLVRCVRSDLHGSAVRVTCVHPGATRTGLFDD